jgi:hypothetical protein
MFRKFAVKKLMVLLPLLAFGGGSVIRAQVMAAAVSNNGLNGFVSFGGLKTHVINYTYNALGIDGGLFLQRSPLVGVEARAASYGMFARYSQMPITGGYRIEVPQSRFRNFFMSAYIGGGMSLAQSAGPHYAPTPAQWSPCWQVSQSSTISMGPLKWKPYEASFIETYTPERTLPQFSLTTGVVYSFSRSGNRY